MTRKNPNSRQNKMKTMTKILLAIHRLSQVVDFFGYFSIIHVDVINSQKRIQSFLVIFYLPAYKFDISKNHCRQHKKFSCQISDLKKPLENHLTVS